LNRSFAEPRESTFWENFVIATMAITGGKCIISHKNHFGPSIYCAWAALSLFCSRKNNMSLGLMLFYY
jgi:hypothetical protein